MISMLRRSMTLEAQPKWLSGWSGDAGRPMAARGTHADGGVRRTRSDGTVRRPGRSRVRGHGLVGVLVAAVWLATLVLVAPAGAVEIPIAHARAAVDIADPQAAAATGAAWIADVIEPVPTRTSPSSNAPSRMTVEPYELDGSVRTLLVRNAFRDATGRDWVEVQLNVRPNGTHAWVPAEAVVLRPVDTRVIVYRDARRLEVWRGSRRVMSVPVGIGRSRTPTPTGRFALDQKWVTDAATRAMYGRYVLTLTAHSNVLMTFNGGDGRIAMHGGAAGRIARPSSFGCVILGDAALRRLYMLAQPGTPVTIVAR